MEQELKNAIDAFIKKVNADIAKEHVEIKRYYSDEYLDYGTAKEWFTKVKEGKDSDLFDEMIESNVEIIAEAEYAITNECIEQNIDMIKPYIPALENVEDVENMVEIISNTVGKDNFSRELLDIPQTKIDLASWFDSYIAYWVVGDSKFGTEYTSPESVVINADFIKWINILGFSVSEFIDDVAEHNQDFRDAFLYANSVKTIDELKAKHKDTKFLVAEKSCTLKDIYSILINASYPGVYIIGVRVDGDDFEKFIKNKSYTIIVEGIGIWDFWNGGGYVTSVSGGRHSVVPIKEVIIDTSEMGIRRAYGRDVW